MAKTRAGLAKLAIAEARRQHSIGPATPISLIGDATSDIIAAQSNRIRAISVETGITPREDLAALKPDFLIRDLRKLRLSMLGIAPS
jgi:phosphoglycolate phosphatase-like HAD superfamily hydrolase